MPYGRWVLHLQLEPKHFRTHISKDQVATREAFTIAIFWLYGGQLTASIIAAEG